MEDRPVEGVCSSSSRWEKLSEDQKAIVREKNRMRVAQKRASLSPQEKMRRLAVERNKAAARRLIESPMNKELRKEKERIRAATRRRNETPEQREQRLKIGREKANERRRNESPASRERRLKAGRERVALKRNVHKKLQSLGNPCLLSSSLGQADLSTLDPSLLGTALDANTAGFLGSSAVQYW